MESEILNDPVADEKTSQHNLRTIPAENLRRYHAEQNHQGPGNELLTPLPTIRSADGPIQCRERLGGVLKYYYREAA